METCVSFVGVSEDVFFFFSCFLMKLETLFRERRWDGAMPFLEHPFLFALSVFEGMFVCTIVIYPTGDGTIANQIWCGSEYACTRARIVVHFYT